MEKPLEREAYQAMKRKAERFGVIASAKSERVFEKRYEQWEEAEGAVGKHISVYETSSWLVSELREGLELVTARGCLRGKSGCTTASRSAEEMEDLIGVVADLMREIPHPKVQAVADRLQRQKGELVKYLEPLQEKLAEFRVQVGDTELVRLCLQEWRLSCFFDMFVPCAHQSSF